MACLCHKLERSIEFLISDFFSPTNAESIVQDLVTKSTCHRVRYEDIRELQVNVEIDRQPMGTEKDATR